MTSTDPASPLPSAQAENIKSVFALQQQHAHKLRASTAAERIQQLKNLQQAIERYRPQIYKAVMQDLGKPEAEADISEVLPAIAEIKHAISHLKRWMKGKTLWPTLAMLGTTAHSSYQPKGVGLIIAPWNYPINLTFGPLASAIAAGCTVMIKPSELCPNVSQLCRKIVEETFSNEQVAVFEGDASTASELLTLPFDHIFFTGSPQVGKIVMRAAAENLSSLTLELGGKCPVIIDESANLKKTARNLAWEKFSNSGQTCVAPDYLLVHESIIEAFTVAMQEALEQAYGSDIANSPDYCRIVNDGHFKRLTGLLEDAQEHGGKVAYGGTHSAEDKFIHPTLVRQPSLESRIMQEEIFGPLLPIIAYSDLDDTIEMINARPKPLALYVFSKNKKNIRKILQLTSSGDASINHSVLHFLHLNMPFGGVGNSGMGKAHGFAGFQAFSHQRSVLSEHCSIAHWLFPPYTPLVKKLIKSIIRFFT